MVIAGPVSSETLGVQRSVRRIFSMPNARLRMLSVSRQSRHCILDPRLPAVFLFGLIWMERRQRRDSPAPAAL
ncbi:MAG: hypothetical protein WCL11_01770 [Verrucomicrobiota bacterium]